MSQQNFIAVRRSSMKLCRERFWRKRRKNEIEKAMWFRWWGKGKYYKNIEHGFFLYCHNKVSRLFFSFQICVLSRCYFFYFNFVSISSFRWTNFVMKLIKLFTNLPNDSLWVNGSTYFFFFFLNSMVKISPFQTCFVPKTFR